MMSFVNYADADGCICDLKSALGDQAEIRHTKANTTNPGSIFIYYSLTILSSHVLHHVDAACALIDFYTLT